MNKHALARRFGRTVVNKAFTGDDRLREAVAQMLAEQAEELIDAFEKQRHVLKDELATAAEELAEVVSQHASDRPTVEMVLGYLLVRAEEEGSELLFWKAVLTTHKDGAVSLLKERPENFLRAATMDAAKGIYTPPKEPRE